MDNIGYIYLLENKIDGNIYVGQTTRSIKNRIKDHIRNDYMIGRALRKYGLKNFKIIVYKLMHDDLDFFEQLFIKNLNTIKPNGYNLESGGHKNRYYSEESKRKMSEAAKKKVFTKKHRENMSKARKGNKNPNYGKQHTVKTKKIISKTHKGKIISKEIRGKMSEAKMGEKNPNYGKTFSINHRRKLSKAKMGGKNGMYGVHLIGEKNHMFNKKHTKESKKKMSEARKKYWTNKKINMGV